MTSDYAAATLKAEKKRADVSPANHQTSLCEMIANRHYRLPHTSLDSSEYAQRNSLPVPNDYIIIQLLYT